MSLRVVEVVPYHPRWPVLFEDEAALLRRTLGDVAVHIHHIGSTSVPGLVAKPIIDILLEVTSLAALDALNEAMRAIGYEPRGELGIPRRRYFPKGGMDRTHQVHAFVVGDEHGMRHLAFRDYLRAHPETAKEYGELKIAIARDCDNDIERYCDGKDAYVKRVEALAIERLELRSSHR
jgi:GrpB-like predicted nucleotidyltransferase (UPF0157 family)